jgi:hypothetical protein
MDVSVSLRMSYFSFDGLDCGTNSGWIWTMAWPSLDEAVKTCDIAHEIVPGHLFQTDLEGPVH